MAAQDAIVSIRTEQVTIPAGHTLGYYVDALPGQVSIQLKYMSGGSLLLIGAASGMTVPGSTMPGATIAALGATFFYLFGTTESLSIAGPARFYLAASAATQVAIIRGISPV
jgi:hypothetical protein